MNQRKLGSILSYLHIIISNTISLIYTPYMLNMMGQSEYGLYGTAGSFISYLTVLSFGIGGAYIRFNAQCRARRDREAEKRLNGMFLTVFSVLALLVMIGGLALTGFAGVLTENTLTQAELKKIQTIMLLLIVNMMLSFVCNVVMMALQAYEKYIFIRLVLLAMAIITPIINIIVLKNGGRAVAITAASLMLSVLSYAIFILYARKSIQMEFSFGHYDKNMLKEIFVFSSFLFLNSITDQITFSTDNVVLISVRGSVEAAIYTVGASFKGYFQQFSTSISSVFAPQINRIVAEHREMNELDEIFIRIGRIQFYVVSLILMGYVSIGRQFIRLWAGEGYENAFWIGLLLMIAVFVPAFQNVGLEIQKAKNMHQARSVVYFLIAILNVLLTIPFSMAWGGVGAALSTTICMFLGTVVFMNWYYDKHVGLDMKAFWKSIMRIVPGYIIPVIAGALISRWMPMDNLMQVLSAALMICVVFAVSVWMFSMNEYEKELIRKPFAKVKQRLS